MTMTLWVASQAPDGGDGSRTAPYREIGEAVDAAMPGTTVMVEPGTYVENVIIRGSGTAEAPIVIKASGSAEETVIEPASDEYDTVEIGGADHIVIDGFTIHVPQSEKNGVIAYARTPDDEFDTASYVTIMNNTIVGGNGDGIKGSKAEYLTITGNTITGHTGTESAIDFVGVRHAEVINNRILDSAHHGVIIKGGSEYILFENNLIKGIAKSGIEVGGYTELPFYWPGFLDEGMEFEVRDVVVRGNEIADTGGTGLRVVGGQDVEIVGNEIHDVDNYLVSIDDSSMYHDVWLSSNVTFEGNSFDGRDWFKNRSAGEYIEPGDNFTDGRDIVDAAVIGTPTETSLPLPGEGSKVVPRPVSAPREKADPTRSKDEDARPQGLSGYLLQFDEPNLAGYLEAPFSRAGDNLIAYVMVPGGDTGPAILNGIAACDPDGVS